MPNDAIVMEDDEGTIEVPQDLAPTPPAAPETPEAPAAETPETPEQAQTPEQTTETPDADQDPDTEPDPRARGLLRALRDTRVKLKEANRVAEAGRNIATALRGRPDIIAALQGGAGLQPPAPPAPVAPPQPPAAPEIPAHVLRDLAETLQLYTADGRPDLDQAKRVHVWGESTARSVAEQIVKQHVAPLNQQMVNGAAQARRAEAMGVLQQFGVDQATGARVIDGLLAENPELLAEPSTAATALLMAIGLDAVQRKHGQPPAAPTTPAAVVTPPKVAPTFTEGPSVRGTAPTMTAVEIAMAKRAGIKPKDWLAQTSRLDKDETKFFVMEDDE